MKNIIYIPLDERPCNYAFMPMLAEGTDYNVLVPSPELMGSKKKPADTDRLWDWIFQNASQAEGAILSIDMLIYGGIIPSRMHMLTVEECKKRIENIRRLKILNPSMQIYAFNLIMRCPSYSSSDEEPDYYEDFGSEISRYGKLTHKADIGSLSEEETKELEHISSVIPSEVLKDYTERRKINSQVNLLTLELLQDKSIDFLVIPQDDSAPLGFTAVDQQFLRTYIQKNDLGCQVYMYPGADEVGMVLFARMVNKTKNRKPGIYVRFSSIASPFITPLYEDRMLYESIKYQIICAGGVVCESLADADMVLMVNSPAENMLESWEQDQKGAAYNVGRNLPEFVEYIDYVVRTKKMPCAVADVAFANGGDLELISCMKQKKLLFEVAAYAGWNTSSNTLGTALAQLLVGQAGGSEGTNLDFLALRYVEDAGYCSHVRNHVTNSVLPSMGYDYFRTDGQRGDIAKVVKSELEKFINTRLADEQYGITIEDVYMPWSRMFEVGLKVRVNPASR